MYRSRPLSCCRASREMKRTWSRYRRRQVPLRCARWQPSPEAAKDGTKLSRGANFHCVLSQTPIEPKYIKAKAIAEECGSANDGNRCGGAARGRIYLPPNRSSMNRGGPSWHLRGIRRSAFTNKFVARDSLGDYGIVDVCTPLHRAAVGRNDRVLRDRDRGDAKTARSDALAATA